MLHLWYGDLKQETGFAGSRTTRLLSFEINIANIFVTAAFLVALATVLPGQVPALKLE